jgi:hypothetical protein
MLPGVEGFPRNGLLPDVPEPGARILRPVKHATKRKLRHELHNLPLAVLLVLLSPLLILWSVAKSGYRRALRFIFRLKWHHYNKFVVFVYSDNPRWKEYIESNILPGIAPHSVTLNRSRAAQWKYRRLEAMIWTHWGGPVEYSPVAIVFPPRQPPCVFRFWTPFNALLYGKEGPLIAARAELFELVNQVATDLAGRHLTPASGPGNA